MLTALLSYFLVGVALSADAASVSLVYGVKFQPFRWRNACIPAAAFGFAQAAMPAVGWGAGSFIHRYVEMFGHWIAFAILLGIGVKFIVDSRKPPEADVEATLRFWPILLAAFATSIDALAVGFSLAMNGNPIVVPALIFGIVTFACCLVACRIGARLGEKFGNRFMLVGGIILIAIGVRIFVAHLMA